MMAADDVSDEEPSWLDMLCAAYEALNGTNDPKWIAELLRSGGATPDFLSVLATRFDPPGAPEASHFRLALVPRTRAKIAGEVDWATVREKVHKRFEIKGKLELARAVGDSIEDVIVEIGLPRSTVTDIDRAIAVSHWPPSPKNSSRSRTHNTHGRPIHPTATQGSFEMDTIVSGERLAYSINEASRATSLGRTRLYQLIAAGRLEVVKIGNRTLIPAHALHKLLDGDQ